VFGTDHRGLCDMMPSSSEGGEATSPIPSDIQAHLSPAQVQRLEAMLAPQRWVHPVDYRVSSVIFGTRFYVTLLAGIEERSHRRLESEGHTRSLAGVAFEFAMICVAVTLMIACTLGVLVMAAKFIFDAAQ
jgi:hypothetical protein